MHLLLYWMKTSEDLDAWSCGGWGVFIALNHQVAVRERLLVMGAPDRHCRLSGAPSRHQTVRVWEQSTVGTVIFLWHRTVWFHTGHCPVCLWLCGSDSARTVSSISGFCSRPLERVAVALLAHRTVRWIIVERDSVFSRVAGSSSYGHGAPDSPVRQSTAHSILCSSLFLSPTWIFYWFVFNLFAPVEHVF
jgi:hypothetical protein